MKTLGGELSEIFDGYRSPLEGMDHAQYEAAMDEGVRRAPFDRTLDRPVDSTGSRSRPKEPTE